MLTLTDPACRHLRARQMQMQRHLRRIGKSWSRGYVPPEGEGVDRHWRLVGWKPSGRIAVVTIERVAA